MEPTLPPTLSAALKMFGQQPIIIFMETHVSPIINANHTGDVNVDCSDAAKMDVSDFLKVLEPVEKTKISLSDEMALNIKNGFDKSLQPLLEEPNEFKKWAKKKFGRELRKLAKELNSRAGYIRYYEYMQTLVLEEAKKNFKIHPDVNEMELF